jgi:hypothetical protein
MPPATPGRLHRWVCLCALATAPCAVQSALQPERDPPAEADPPPGAAATTPPDAPAPPQPPPDPAVALPDIFSLSVRGGHNFEADIEGAGSVRSSAAGVGFGVRQPLNEQLSLGVSVGAGARHYDFRGDSGLFPEPGVQESPWETAHTWSVGASAMYRANRRLLLFGALNGSSSGEAGADFRNTLTGGVSLGFAYSFSKELTLGLTATAQTRLEDDLFVLPLPTVNWTLPGDPQGRWRLQIGRVQGGPPTAAGAAIVYAPSPAVSVFGGIGASGLGGDFRLDDDGPVPGGVGRDQSFPLILGLDWRPSPALHISAFGGVSMLGEIELLDAAGRTIGKRDVDPAPTIGLAVTWQF